MRTTLFYQYEEAAFEGFLISKKYSQIFLLADAKTNGFCIPVLKKIVPYLSDAQIIVIPDGEQNKQLDSCNLIWQQLIHHHADRNTLLINIGGGMVSDIGGLASSLYKRGIDSINIPTTLLSMVDASQGGKTGIDIDGIKNVIGSFHHPVVIYTNPIFLHTLSERNLKSGMAEMLKHALIHDESLWNTMQSFTLEDFQNIENIKTSMAIKQYFVAQDEQDLGIRQALNFGHSIGHAIESHFLHSSSPLLHGEAIMLGMEVELALSCIKCNLNLYTLKDFQQVKNNLFPNLKHQYTLAEIEPYLLQDKKNNSEINMSLISAIGNPTIKVPINTQDIIEAYSLL